MFKPKQKIPIITELAFPQPQIFCMQQAALQFAEIMDRIWRSRADAVSDPSPVTTHTLSSWARVSRASHVFVDVDASFDVFTEGR